jgi:hypothetical protein
MAPSWRLRRVQVKDGQVDVMGHRNLLIFCLPLGLFLLGDFTVGAFRCPPNTDSRMVFIARTVFWPDLS